MKGHEHDETCLTNCRACGGPINDGRQVVTDQTGHEVHWACAIARNWCVSRTSSAESGGPPQPVE